MSKFLTRVPVPVQQVIEALPKGAFVHRWSYDHVKQEVLLEWEHEPYATGYTFAVDYPMADLLAGKRPNGLKPKKAIQTPPEAKNAPTSPPEREKGIPVNIPDHNWDKERFEKERAAGTAIEYQGVESVWKPLATDDVWQEGFLYRKKVVANPIASA